MYACAQRLIAMYCRIVYQHNPFCILLLSVHIQHLFLIPMQYAYLHTHVHTCARSRLSVLYEYHRAFKIQPVYLITLVNHVTKNTPVLSKGTRDGSTNSSEEDEWSNQLFQDLQTILMESMNIMDDHLAFFNTKASEDVEYLKGLLQ